MTPVAPGSTHEGGAVLEVQLTAAPAPADLHEGVAGRVDRGAAGGDVLVRVAGQQAEARRRAGQVTAEAEAEVAAPVRDELADGGLVSAHPLVGGLELPAARLRVQHGPCKDRRA